MFEKVTKGVKKAAKATYNFAVGDDIKTLQSKNTKWYQKAGAAVSIASNFIPGGGVASKVAKAAIKVTAKASTAVKASKAIVKSSKVVKSTAKKAASTINKKPKVVPAPSIKSAPKTQSVAPVKVSNTTPAAKPKVASTPQPKRGLVATRSETNANVVPPAAKGCNCFTAGTKVVTEDGEKNIEDIEVGDKVLAKDEKNADGELAYKEVEALYRNQRDDIIKLHVGDQIIETTDNHPFWVEGKGWVFADELQAGDQLQKADGTNLTIEKVEFIKLDEPVTVYNFTVEDYHTYYVTDIGIWVHNTNTDACSLGFTKGIDNSKIIYPSKPHTNKTTGHWETMMDKADELAKSDNILKVYLNKGISNEIPGLKPNRRPDIMAVRMDGKIDQYEVPSKTDDINALINRMKNTQQLLGERAGNINILRIKK